MEAESKTSDEILEELFSALNVPLSPKTQKEAAAPPTTTEAPQEENHHSGASEGSVGEEENNKEVDSKSSDTEEDTTKGQEEEKKMGKMPKHKTSKKKKEKKKKKKKHKKKDDDSHKSKKKRKRDSVIEAEESNNSKILTQEALSKAEKEVVEKLSTVVQEQDDKYSSPPHYLEIEKTSLLPKSKSPRSEEESSKPSTYHSTKVKNYTVSNVGIKEEPSKKLIRKLESPQRSHTSSKSVRSRSRSTSRLRQQRYSRSRSRSKIKLGKGSRSRSRSISKHSVKRRSRSNSRTKSSRHRSKAKSPPGLDKPKRGRKSWRSDSKSLSPQRSKRKTKRRSSRSCSKSLSPPKIFEKKKRFSTSRSPPSPTRISSEERCRRSRSGSGSPPKRLSRPRENFNLPRKLFQNSLHLESSKNQQQTVEVDLSSIPTPSSSKQSGCPSTLPISLENIPLPVPPVSSEVPDPSSIPLPQPVIHSKYYRQQSLKEEELVETAARITGRIDVGTIPVPVAAAAAIQTPPVKEEEQEVAKPPEPGSEKGKAKMIIIKSLKDSLIYMQAQEEAERRAKVKQDGETQPAEDKVEEIIKEDDPHQEEAQEEEEEVEEEEEEEEAEEEEEEEEEAAEEEEEEKEEEEEATAAAAAAIKENEETLESHENTVQAEEDLNGMEGEIASDCDNEELKTKSHKKKSKKDKEKSKEKKKAKKEKSKEKKKRSREKSKSRERANKSRSKSKEHHHSKHKRSSSNWHRERDVDRRYRRYSRSRSRSRDRFSRFRHRSYSRSRSRSRSRSGRKRDCVTDLRDKVTRKRLLEIARRNAVYLMQNGCLPPSVEQEQLVKIKTGGKSVEELTDFCKQLVASGNYSDVELSDPSLSSDDDNENPDKPFSYTRHPFNVRDSKPILMNIRNAPMLPTKTNAERLADHAKLREQFPVSSGSQHRNKGEVNTTEEKLRTADSGWVPVSPKEKKPKEEDSVFSKEEPPAVDISQIVSSRLSAMRKLQDNPHDIEALKTLHNVQKEMQSWALSKQEPGQFTGSTGVKILSQEELCAGQQAWVRKEQFKEAAPVRPQFGLKMLQKMGWTPGEGLGKNKEGAIEPLLLDVKMDKKGFHAQEELTPKKQPIPMAKDLSARKCNKLHSGIGKHPVSALVEFCSKHKWQPPEFQMVFDYGPDHKKNFLMKVKVNGQEYKPAVAGPTKKLAKANAAAACLQSLGLFPKDPENPLTEA